MMWARRIIALAGCCAAGFAYAQNPTPACAPTTGELYAQIRSVGLDPGRVYRVRDASVDRPGFHLDLEDGTLAFTADVCGRITGAFFEGDGEVRLRPPNKVERASLTLFTGMAILEEQFHAAYLRFNDDTAARLGPFLSPAIDGPEFFKEWDDSSRILAEFDALRLLLDFSHFLPSSSGARPQPEPAFPSLLHVHILGRKLGAFEVVYDAAAGEPVWAGQPRSHDGEVFFDIWTSFVPASASELAPRAADVSVTAFRIRAVVQPPTRLQVTTEVSLRVKNGGERTLLFELSRFLKIESIGQDGRQLAFIQNPALDGSQLQRQRNDLVAVVFPAPLAKDQELELKFTYAGDVLSQAGNGLLYVGARGTWYPNLGLSPARFDMEFHYPASWTLLATGTQQPQTPGRNGEAGADPGDGAAERVSRWIADQPIPVAGFNLGKYVRAEAKAGNVLVEAFGARGVERSFPQAPPEVIESPTFPGRHKSATLGPIVVSPAPPSPARNVQAVADHAAQAIASFSRWFGPFPYSSLALTQMPGDLSQGWPGLVFLSSFAFLSPQEQAEMRLDPVARDLDSQILVHETAHQWWGDLVLWTSYRDQWIAEGLANYASLLTLEQRNPAQFREIMEKYRRDLLGTNKDGERLRDAGPVTLGPRLESSHFPGGYEAVSYERGTWMFHMLRSMLRDAASTGSDFESRSRKSHSSPLNPDEPFFRALRRIRNRFAGRRLSTSEMLLVFEEDLPRPLWYEKRPKLDWFLEGWIEGRAIPELDAREIRLQETGGVTAVSGVILQKNAPDDLVTAVPVYGETSANVLVFLGEVLADGAETSFHLTTRAQIHKILLDPKQTILTSPR